MASRLRTETLPANGRIELGGGNLFFLTAATAALTLIKFVRGGSFSAEAEGVGAGYYKANVESWRGVVITGAAGTTITFFHGDEEVSEDVTDYRQGIASISGSVNAYPGSDTYTTPDELSIANATSVDIAASATRKRLTVTVTSGQAGSLWLRDQAGTANAGQEIQSGQQCVCYSRAALRIRNNSGGALNYTVTTET